MTSAPLCGSRLLHSYREEGECLQPRRTYNVEATTEGARKEARKRERDFKGRQEVRSPPLCPGLRLAVIC